MQFLCGFYLGQLLAKWGGKLHALSLNMCCQDQACYTVVKQSIPAKDIHIVVYQLIQQSICYRSWEYAQASPMSYDVIYKWLPISH